uniref:RNA-directed DNA polymerase, eukaryota n=1 Tax=Tanacetum cinerariifolium TaxID=118510 RepID=A0A6L2MC59_TANCI|nr:RNA-directed DNA polymerase, eukaryota [Tanacetum cinerariifolium]
MFGVGSGLLDMLRERLDLRLLSGSPFEFGVLDYEYCDASWVSSFLRRKIDEPGLCRAQESSQLLCGRSENLVEKETVVIATADADCDRPAFVLLYLGRASKLSHSNVGFSLRHSPRGGAELEQFMALSSNMEGLILLSMQDRWTWSLSSSREFSIASVRNFIDDYTLDQFPSKTRWIKAVCPSSLLVL